jgi:hypothetical protein
VVKDSRKALCVGSVKPVNVPEQIQIKEDCSGLPVMVKMSRKQVITAIDDCWRIDDEWWRSESVSRLYYAVRFVSGQRLIIYKDLIDGRWYRQAY